MGDLPRLEIKQGGRAGAVASKASGEGGAVPVDESMQGSSGTLGSTGSFGVELRSQWRGQGGRNRAGNVEFHWRSTYRRRRPGEILALRGRSSGQVGLGNSLAALRSFCMT